MNCAICGTKIIQTGKGRKRKWCSPECKLQAHREYNREWGRKNRPPKVREHYHSEGDKVSFSGDPNMWNAIYAG